MKRYELAQAAAEQAVANVPYKERMHVFINAYMDSLKQQDARKPMTFDEWYQCSKELIEQYGPLADSPPANDWVQQMYSDYLERHHV